MRGKELILETTESGCIVPTSHKLNKDGYFRTRDFRFTGSGRKPLIFYHRLVWELQYGEIPDGYEIDHKCRNRACCNIDHLQMLTGKQHTVKTNRERYSERKLLAKSHWEETKCTGSELAERFGVSQSTGCKWVREWKV